MAFVRKENEEKILDLWENDKSIEEILAALDWGPKSGGNVTRVLRRAGYEIPKLRSQDDYKLRKKDIKNMHGVESLVFESNGENPDYNETELRNTLHNMDFRWLETRNALPFGQMQVYRSASTHLKIISREQQGKEQVLVIIDGLQKRTENIAERITAYYKEKGFTPSKAEDSQSIE